jgi:hypothetical protein
MKDPTMLNRLNAIEKMDSEDKSHILHVLDGFIKSVKFKTLRYYKTKAPVKGLLYHLLFISFGSRL